MRIKEHLSLMLLDLLFVVPNFCSTVRDFFHLHL